jgi:hypothetical protein
MESGAPVQGCQTGIDSGQPPLLQSAVMNESDDFALVPKPPSALEKTEPGAKRILSGIVSDTLALAKKPPVKRVFRVLTCSNEEAIRGTIQIVVQGYLGETCAVIVTDRAHGSEILEFVQQQPIDLIVGHLGNIIGPLSNKGRGSLVKSYQGTSLSDDLEIKLAPRS